MEGSSRPISQLLVTVVLSAFFGGAFGTGAALLVEDRAFSGFFGGAKTTVSLSPERVEASINNLLEEEAATIAVVDRVIPAVVSIIIEQRYEDLADVWKDPSDEVSPDEWIEIGGGSGFFVTEDGYIITNRHVISDEDAMIYVLTESGEKLEASIAAVDPFLDLALLDVEGEGYPIVTLGDSDKLQIGSTVIAIGNTLAEFQNTVTKGVVSGVNRRVIAGDENGDDLLDHAIQTDAAINPGNSGGPLINLLGEVVGVNSAVSTEGQSIGFAIPVNEIKRAIVDVQKTGRIIRPWLGVRYLTLNEEVAEEERLAYTEGAWILVDPEGGTGVVPESPAEKAGLMEGDIIISVNDQMLHKEQELGPVIAQYYPGDVVMLEIYRGNETLSIPVTLGEVPLL